MVEIACTTGNVCCYVCNNDSQLVFFSPCDFCVCVFVGLCVSVCVVVETPAAAEAVKSTLPGVLSVCLRTDFVTAIATQETRAKLHRCVRSRSPRRPSSKIDMV